LSSARSATSLNPKDENTEKMLNDLSLIKKIE
jgi:hypothetical protein